LQEAVKCMLRVTPVQVKGSHEDKDPSTSNIQCVAKRVRVALNSSLLTNIYALKST
jgi:hypothetical protein